MSQFAVKVFCIICLLAAVAGGGSVAVGRALPYGGPTASTEALPWSAL